MNKPRIFLGSSGKQEKLLQALTRGLENVAHVEPWTFGYCQWSDRHHSTDGVALVNCLRHFDRELAESAGSV